MSPTINQVFEPDGSRIRFPTEAAALASGREPLDLADLERSVQELVDYLAVAGFALSTTASYRAHALRFVRWLSRRYESGPTWTGIAQAPPTWSIAELVAERDRYAGELAESDLAPKTVYQYTLGTTAFIRFLGSPSRYLAAIGASGECRMQTPYRPLSPILDPGGLRYCCDHRPTQHCSAAVAPVQPE